MTVPDGNRSWHGKLVGLHDVYRLDAVPALRARAPNASDYPAVHATISSSASSNGCLDNHGEHSRNSVY
jgi:hypothetical protein